MSRKNDTVGTLSSLSRQNFKAAAREAFGGAPERDGFSKNRHDSFSAKIHTKLRIGLAVFREKYLHRPPERLSLYLLKPSFSAWLLPVTKSFYACGIKPNHVTAAAILLSVVAGAILALWPEANAALFLLTMTLGVRMALNAIDGDLARRHGKESRLGFVLNEIERVVSDIVLYLPLALVPEFSATLIITFVILVVIKEGLRFVDLSLSEHGLQKPDRAFVVGMLALLIGLGVPPGLWLDVVLSGICLLMALGIVLPLFRLLRESLR